MLDFFQDISSDLNHLEILSWFFQFAALLTLVVSVELAIFWIHDLFQKPQVRERFRPWRQRLWRIPHMDDSVSLPICYHGRMVKLNDHMFCNMSFESEEMVWSKYGPIPVSTRDLQPALACENVAKYLECLEVGSLVHVKGLVNPFSGYDPCSAVFRVIQFESFLQDPQPIYAHQHPYNFLDQDDGSDQVLADLVHSHLAWNRYDHSIVVDDAERMLARRWCKLATVTLQTRIEQNKMFRNELYACVNDHNGTIGFTMLLRNGQSRKSTWGSGSIYWMSHMLAPFCSAKQQRLDWATTFQAIDSTLNENGQTNCFPHPLIDVVVDYLLAMDPDTMTIKRDDSITYSPFATMEFDPKTNQVR